MNKTYQSLVPGHEGLCELQSFSPFVGVPTLDLEKLIIAQKYKVWMFANIKEKTSFLGGISYEAFGKYFWGYIKEDVVYSIESFDHEKEQTLIGRIIALEKKVNDLEHEQKNVK